MTENFILYIIVWIIWLLSVFAFVVGVEKMIKIVLGNYILWSICLAASQSIDFLVNFFNATPELKTAWITFKTLWTFFADGKTIIVLILYAVLLVVIYKTSKIHVHLPEDPAMNKWLYILFVPLTVLSMILTLQIAITWINGIHIEQLQTIGKELTNNPGIYTFLTMTPVWILLHGLATILITSELKVGLKTGI